MSKIQLLRGFLNQRLTAAAEEIFEVVEQTIAEYQEECFRTKEENVRLQKLLDIVIKPEIKTSSSSLSLRKRFPLSSNTVRRNGAPIWGRRLKRNRRNSGPIRGKSSFKGWRKSSYSLLPL
ncbi:uncharacterized protein isoform X2 [Salmo salar]|uniref:Uncharacterized protein isoform X2 n=1 Tax=Salmo salar TaxID=8030 RepID=A0ABM3CRM3_SALSA|nr:uncharacterized protein LOC106570461 isoform X2 [Salmo salar]